MSNSDFKIRPSLESDSRYFWEWRNATADLSKSFSPEKIAWDDHQRWFSDKLRDSSCYLYTMELRGQPVGQLRIDLDGAGRGEVHISVVSAHRCRGFGKRALELLLEALKNNVHVITLVAHIKLDNVPSVVMFLKAGYRFTQRVQYKGIPCYEMEFYP